MEHNISLSVPPESGAEPPGFRPFLPTWRTAIYVQELGTVKLVLVLAMGLGATCTLNFHNLKFLRVLSPSQRLQGAVTEIEFKLTTCERVHGSALLPGRELGMQVCLHKSLLVTSCMGTSSITSGTHKDYSWGLSEENKQKKFTNIYQGVIVAQCCNLK